MRACAIAQQLKGTSVYWCADSHEAQGLVPAREKRSVRVRVRARRIAQRPPCVPVSCAAPRPLSSRTLSRAVLSASSIGCQCQERWQRTETRKPDSARKPLTNLTAGPGTLQTPNPPLQQGDSGLVAGGDNIRGAALVWRVPSAQVRLHGRGIHVLAPLFLCNTHAARQSSPSRHHAARACGGACTHALRTEGGACERCWSAGGRTQLAACRKHEYLLRAPRACGAFN